MSMDFLSLDPISNNCYHPISGVILFKRISLFLKSSNSPLEQKVSGALARPGRKKAINRGGKRQ